MALFALFVTLAVVLCAINAQAPTWKVGTADKLTSIMGVVSHKANEVYGAFLQNGYGSGMVYSEDYAATSTLYGPFGLMNMDIALTKDGSTGCIASMGLLVGPAKSDQYKKVPNLRGVSQNVEPYGDNGFVAAGQFVAGKVSVNGAAYSTDAGASWQFSDIGLNSTTNPARYASFPSSQAWYVTSGTWPMDSAADSTSRRLSSRLVAGEKQLAYKPLVRAAATDAGDCPGAISRSTDGGKTWTKVFDSQGAFYMNAISCFDDTHCVAVGENDAAWALTTSDGVTWQTSLTAPVGISLIAAKMVGPQEAWVSGGGQDGRSLTGYYYHTTDGGATWELSKLPGYAVDLTFSSPTSGFSAFLTQSYSSLAVYN